MTFTTRNLTGDRVLVQGTDVDSNSGKTVLDGSQWAELGARNNLNKAQEIFDAAVEEMFAPLIKAAEAAEQAMAKPVDSIGYVVLDEGSEGEAATPRRVVTLTKDSVILRLIEEGNTDRLIWIGDQLEVLDAAGPSVASAGGSAAEDTAGTEAGDPEITEA